MIKKNTETPLQILLATFNSRKYLRAQLDSLFAQDYQNFQLVIRDGGSTDDTMEIIQAYEQKYPGRIEFLGIHKSKALENFSELLKASSAQLIMFCDHDDVWLPQKVSHTLAKYQEAEAAYGAETPILVFTDSRVANQEMKIISPSMLQYQHLDAVCFSLNRLILQNTPSGNTMLFNRALADLAQPIPPDAVMHDHWVTLVAAAFGKVIFLNEATLDYRQHGNNVYGASCYSIVSMLKKTQCGRRKIINRFEENIRQAVAFGKRYGTELPLRDREMFEVLDHWKEYGFIGKRKVLLKYHILKSGFFRNLGMFILI